VTLLALLIAALAVVPAHRHETLPSPPHVKIVVGRPPGWTGPFTAASDGHTIWRARHVDRFTLEHELGLLFDEQVLTNADRRYFMRLMRLRGPWTQAYETTLGQRQGGARSPEEWFADWYANARMRCGPSLGSCWTYGYADSPTWDRQFKRFLWRVRRAAARDGR
jgi:hypothetical protein